MAAQKHYVTPAVETLDSSEILELIGPVQGYGPGATIGIGGHGILSVTGSGSSGAPKISR